MVNSYNELFGLGPHSDFSTMPYDDTAYEIADSLARDMEIIYAPGTATVVHGRSIYYEDLYKVQFLCAHMNSCLEIVRVHQGFLSVAHTAGGIACELSDPDCLTKFWWAAHHVVIANYIWGRKVNAGLYAIVEGFDLRFLAYVWSNKYVHWSEIPDIVTVGDGEYLGRRAYKRGQIEDALLNPCWRKGDEAGQPHHSGQ